MMPLNRRGFSRAIRPDHGEQRALRDVARDVMHGGMPVIAERQVVENDSGLCAR